MFSAVSSYDNFLFGDDPSSLTSAEDGSYVPSKGELKAAVESLPALLFVRDGTTRRVTATRPILRECELPSWSASGAPTRMVRTGNDECRLRNCTWALQLRASLVVDGKRERFSSFFGEIPLIVGTRFPVTFEVAACDPFDRPGYFVVGGSERFVVAKERRRHRVPYLFHESDGKPCLEMKYENDETFALRRKGEVIYAYFRRLFSKEGIEVGALAKSLNVPVDRAFSHPSADVRSVLESVTVPKGENERYDVLGVKCTEEEIFRVLGKRLRFGREGSDVEYSDAVRRFLDERLFPFLGTNAARKKSLFVSCVREFAEFCAGKRPETDMEALENKRVDDCGTVFAALFRQGLRVLWADYARRLRVAKPNADLVGVFNSGSKDCLTQHLRRAMITGNFSEHKKGMTQMLRRTNARAEASSQIARIEAPVSSMSANLKSRKIHPTQYGFLDPCETPEGKRIGFVKNSAISTRISTKGDFDAWRVFAETVCDSSSFSVPRLIVDGWIVGKKLPGTLEEMRRRKREVDRYAAVYEDERGDVVVDLSSGRYQRPLYVNVPGEEVVDTHGLWEKFLVPLCDRFDKIRSPRCVLNGFPLGRLKRKFSEDYFRTWATAFDPRAVVTTDSSTRDLDVLSGFVEWVDANEQNRSLVAFRLSDLRDDHTHAEIDPSFLLGKSANRIPFSHRNAGARNVLASHAGHQAMGTPTLDASRRFDTYPTNRMYYPQKALLDTRVSRANEEDVASSGTNVFVLICADAFNQEDSIVVKAEAIQRGLFRSWKERSFCETIKTDDGESTVGGTPRKPYDYSKLDSDGVVSPGEFLTKNTVLVSKFKNGVDETSVVYDGRRHKENARVSDVMITEDFEGNRVVKVKIRIERVPVTGDKFASRHGQKGVITVRSEEDFPRTAEGVAPDFIVNPLAFVGRMTIGMVFEQFVSSAVLEDPDGFVLGGGKFDCSTFSEKFNLTMEDVATRNYEYERPHRDEDARPLRYGSRRFYRGDTGTMIESPMSAGYVFYQRLDHQVADKLNARMGGITSFETGQPIGGKQALRFGDMERTVVEARGMFETLHELFGKRSDGVIVAYCDVCEDTEPTMTSAKTCSRCGYDRVREVETFRSFVNLRQELRGVGLRLKMLPND